MRHVYPTFTRDNPLQELLQTLKSLHSAVQGVRILAEREAGIVFADADVLLTVELHNTQWMISIAGWMDAYLADWD